MLVYGVCEIMGNVAVCGVQASNNVVDISDLKNEAKVAVSEEKQKAGSLFLVVNQDKEAETIEKEKAHESQELGKINPIKIVAVNPFLDVDKKEFHKQLLRAKIKIKQARIEALIKKKKKMNIKNCLFGAIGGASAGVTMHLILGSGSLVITGLSAIGVLAVHLNNFLFNKKIDAKIANLEKDIALLKRSYELIA